MKFKDLAIGDWFHDAKGLVHLEDAVFIKVNDTAGYAINWKIESVSKFNAEFEVEFVPSFICEDGYYTKSRSTKAFEFDKFDSLRDSKVIYKNNFNDIPISALFVYKNTIYKKCSINTALVIWSNNYDILGTFYTFSNLNKVSGYLIEIFRLYFPESGIKTP